LLDIYGLSLEVGRLSFEVYDQSFSVKVCWRLMQPLHEL